MTGFKRLVLPAVTSLAALVGFFSAKAAQAQQAPAVPPVNQPAAPGRTSPLSPVQMCLATAADFSPVYPGTEFPGNIREISCAFQIGDQDIKKLTSIWTAVDVGDVAPPNYEMTRNELSVSSMKRGALRYSQNGPMPVGKYKVDVLADGKPWQSLQFTIVHPPDAMAIGKPEELFPLDEGRSWKYNFVQQAGQGVTITIPGVEPDAEGKLHAHITMNVAKSEPAGTHIEILRDGALVAEEWWKLDARGLTAQQRKIGDELIKLDPPQVLWPLPLESPKQWKYETQDGAVTQTNQMWGPLPLNDPGHAGDGYIVLIEQPNPIGRMTVERHFIPRFGLTRETIVSAMNGELTNKQDMSLAGDTTAQDHHNTAEGN